jgi:hypothetical protein
VSGRNSLSWEDKFALDVDYVERRSLALDLSILWRTLAAVLRRQCIRGGGATMSEFVEYGCRSREAEAGRGDA